MSRTQVEIKTEDGICPTSVFTPNGTGPWPGVIFYMDGPGIRPLLFEMGQRLASAGYVVLLPDLFYRAGPYAPINPAEMFADPEKRAAHGKFFTSTGNAKAAADTRAFLDYLDTRNDVQGKRVGVTGYCMGGGMVLTAAATYPDRDCRGREFSWRPACDRIAEQSAPARAVDQGARACHRCRRDAGFPPEQADLLRKALAAAKVDHRVEIWPGAAHGWTMKDIPIYNEAAAERHWQELLGLFDATLH